MGLYLRKYIKVGPLRFNLSKSGVGVSAGVRGLRVATGPRGNYVHMGRYGLYYRQSLPGATPLKDAGRSDAISPAEDPTHDELVEIESGDVSTMVDSSSADLLAELNGKIRKREIFPTAVVMAVLSLLVGAFMSLPLWALGTIAGVGLIGSVLAHQRDLLSKTAVVFYDFDPDTERAYESFLSAAKKVASCNRVWLIEAQGGVRDRKYHAGASNIVRRRPTSIRTAEPPYLKTNVETLALGAGRQVLYFFPDRVLVYDQHRVGAVGYDSLTVAVDQERFVEDEPLPSDAKIVDRTWEYVNKKGGPDRRFKNNRELPICLYEKIAFRSETGLNEQFQVSRCNVGDLLSFAVQRLAAVGSTGPKKEPDS